MITKSCIEKDHILDTIIEMYKILDVSIDIREINIDIDEETMTHLYNIIGPAIKEDFLHDVIEHLEGYQKHILSWKRYCDTHNLSQNQNHNPSKSNEYFLFYHNTYKKTFILQTSFDIKMALRQICPQVISVKRFVDIPTLIVHLDEHFQNKYYANYLLVLRKLDTFAQEYANIDIEESVQAFDYEAKKSWTFYIFQLYCGQVFWSSNKA